MRRVLALAIAALGIYIGLVACEQGASDLGVWVWIGAAGMEYLILISQPETRHGKRKDDRE